jgi:hypothetical protein
MAPMVWWRKVAWMYYHEQPSFFIWSSVVSSFVVHRTRFFWGCNDVCRILDYVAASWQTGGFAGASPLEQMSNASGLIGRLRCSEIDHRWQFELDIVRYVIPDHCQCKKALKRQFLIFSGWYWFIAVEGLPGVREVWWCSLSMNVGAYLLKITIT